MPRGKRAKKVATSPPPDRATRSRAQKLQGEEEVEVKPKKLKEEKEGLGLEVALIRYDERDLPEPAPPLPPRSESEGEERLDLTEGHEIEILQAPRQLAPSMREEQPGSSRSRVELPVKRSSPRTESSPPIIPPPDAPLTRSRVSRSFYHECVEDWQYTGVPTKLNFGDENVRYSLRNRFWHEVKQKTGTLLRVIVEQKNDDDPDRKTLVFNVLSYTKKRGKYINELLATTSVSSKAEHELRFRFKITDADLAEKNSVSVKALLQTCERVFGTIVVRCTGQSGSNDLEIGEDEENLGL